MDTKPFLDFSSIAEVELTYRRGTAYQESPQIVGSNPAYEVLKAAWDENKMDLLEQFKILLLSHSNHCLGVSHIATGGLSGCVADPRIVFATALKANASSIILAHNHPSGNLTASQADIELTKKMKAGGKLLDISVLDHLILSSHGYMSMGDEGLMPG